MHDMFYFNEGFTTVQLATLYSDEFYFNEGFTTVQLATPSTGEVRHVTETYISKVIKIVLRSILLVKCLYQYPGIFHSEASHQDL